MKRLRKLKNNAGFSLAEMLMAVLILLMVSLIVATGMPAARNAYEKTVIGSNAQAMLSTAVSALRDELGTAWDVQVSGTTVTYFKADTGTRATISNDGVIPEGKDASAYNSITIQDFVEVDFIHDPDSEGKYKNGNIRALVPDSNTDLYVTYSSVSYTNNIVKIGGLEVRRQKDSTNTPLAKLDTDLEIRVLSPN